MGYNFRGLTTYDLRLTTILIAMVIFSGCKKPEVQNNQSESKGNYFSIKQFTQDQWNTFHGEPVSLVKTVKLDGKTDSSYVNANTMDWGAVFKTFFESDISDKKYLDHYNFTMFEDDGMQTRDFYYEAKDKDLFTRKLMITADQFTNKIRSIYIETEKKGGWTSRSQKLYYAPMKLIQIQEYEKPFIGHAKELIVEYRFLL